MVSEPQSSSSIFMSMSSILTSTSCLVFLRRLLELVTTKSSLLSSSLSLSVVSTGRARLALGLTFAGVFMTFGAVFTGTLGFELLSRIDQNELDWEDVGSGPAHLDTSVFDWTCCSAPAFFLTTASFIFSIFFLHECISRSMLWMKRDTHARERRLCGLPNT